MFISNVWQYTNMLIQSIFPRKNMIYALKSLYIPLSKLLKIED